MNKKAISNSLGKRYTGILSGRALSIENAAELFSKLCLNLILKVGKSLSDGLHIMMKWSM